MTFVHSFWSKPLLNNKFNVYEEQLPIVLSNYAYSAFCVKKQGHKIKLFADRLGAEMLDFIHYDEVIILDNLDNECIHFAAQIKFEALKRMTLDECLIDGDMFLSKKDVFVIISSINTDFLYTIYEPYPATVRAGDGLNNYKKLKKTFLKYKDKFLPPYNISTKNEDLQWPNTSFMKISNQELKDEYIRQYEYHKNVLKDETDFAMWPDIFIEQLHLRKLLESKNYSHRPLIYDFPSRATNDYSYKIGLCHLGAEKEILKDMIYKRLKEANIKLYNLVFEQAEKYKEKPL